MDVICVSSLMMIIWNLLSKEGVRFKQGICTKLRLKLWFKSNWYFCNIFKLKYFQSNCSEKILNNRFLKSVEKQLYVDVLQNRCYSKFCNIHRKTSILESLLIKLQVSWRSTLLKRDFNTSVFQWIFKIVWIFLWILKAAFFTEHLQWLVWLIW